MAVLGAEVEGFSLETLGFEVVSFEKLEGKVFEEEKLEGKTLGSLVSWCPLKTFFHPSVRMMTSKKPPMLKIYCLPSMFQLLRSSVFFAFEHAL